MSSRRAGVAAGLIAVCAVSAATTVALVRSMSRPAAVAGASSSSLFADAPGLPLLTPRRVALARQGSIELGAHVTVPILVYHYIRTVTNPKDHVGWGLSVPYPIFKEQMDWLRQVGGHTVTLAEVMAALNGGAQLPPRSVVLTFDDGHSDFATQAVPVLLSDGFIATAFVNTGFLGRPSYMTAAQVQQVAGEGMVIGDHTVNHVDLNALSPAAAKTEIDADRAILQSLTGESIGDFAYPYGDFDGTVVAVVAAAGFRDAVSMQLGDTEWVSQPFVWPRIRVGGGDTVWSFAGKAGIPAPPANWVDKTA